MMLTVLDRLGVENTTHHHQARNQTTRKNWRNALHFITGIDGTKNLHPSFLVTDLAT